MDHKFPNIAFQFNPKSRRDVGTSKKENVNYEVGTGQRLTLESKMMAMMLIYPLHVKQRPKIT